MRISGNFNIPKPNFRALHVQESAVDLVKQYMHESPDFCDTFQELTPASDNNDDDILIGTFNRGKCLNYRATDPFTNDTTCYLAAHDDPQVGAKKALERYLKHSAAPKPKAVSTEDTSTKLDTRIQGNGGKRRKLFGIF